MEDYDLQTGIVQLQETNRKVNDLLLKPNYFGLGDGFWGGGG